MPKTLLILFFLVQMFFAPSHLWSQSKYPIYVTPTLLPPYSLNLSDYSAYGSQKLMVTVVVNDLEIANLPVKLRIKMETAGVTIENPYTLNTTPIFLDGGSANVLFGEDFVDYFNINNLQFKGYSKEAYRRSGQLPEGFYRFTVEVLHFHTNRVISNAGTVTAWIALGKPPILRSPANDVQLGQYNGIPVTFSWLASNVGSPVSAGSIRYKFQMWEVRVKGVNPYNVVNSMPMFYEHITSNTSYSFNPASVMMEEGLTYAWRVTAYDESGFVPFEQNGQSEVRIFTYKSLCEEVESITAASSGQKGTFTWQPDKNHTSYNVEIKNDAAGWFSANETFDSKVEFYQLERGSTYEMRVQAVCNGDPNSTSDYSDWTKLTIAEAESNDNNDDCPDCGCNDDMQKVQLTNFELRTDLAPGDIVSNKTGTTRFILKNLEPQGEGVYKGVFYFWAEIWGLKIPCEFWDLQVNTDNVVVNMDYKSINDPAFLLDVDVLVDNANHLLDQAAVLTSDGTIAGSIEVMEDFDHIVVKEGQLVAVTINENGEAIEKPLNISAEEAKNKMITNSNGDALVVNSKGEAMGVTEFQETGGGNTRLMKNYNKEKESKELTPSTMVTFSSHPTQNYGFDRYTEQKSLIQKNYPVLENGHRPAFKSVESFKYDKVAISSTEGIKFRDEMGIPSAAVDGGISLSGASHGSTKALYAYRENEDKTEEIVGKLSVVSFDNEPKRVHIIPVNDAKLPSASELEATLTHIYKQAVATWTVLPEEKVSVDFPNGIMTHEGSGTFSTYNKDQNAIANAYEASNRKFEPGDIYLFFVKEATFKERSLAGFMPLQRQIGFIYGSPSLEIVAHELAHGTFNLRHTFSPEAFIEAERKTQNLMDYAGGTELWKHQWDAVHNPERVMFAWGQDESEGASVIDKPGEVRVITELVRYAYACDKSIKIKSGTPSTNKIILGDDHEYSYVGIYIKEDVTISNLKNSIQTDIPPRTWDGNEKKRIGFGNNSIEFITLTDDKSKLESYLTSSQNKETYLTSIDKLISNWEAHYYNLNALPSDALKDLSNSQRINLLTKIANSDIRNVDGLAVRVMDNVSKANAIDFINSLKNTSIFSNFKNKMSFADYTAFIKSSVSLFYQQDYLSEKLNNIDAKNMLTWHIGIGANGIGDQINYKFSVLGEKLRIKAEAEKWVAHGAPGMQSAKFEGKVLIKDETYYMTEMLGIYLSEGKLGHIDAVGKVVPIPVFYFDWICEAQKRETTIKAIDASVTALSLAVGIGELRMVAAAGRGVFIVKTSLGILKSAVNLGLLDDDLRISIEEKEWGQGFLDKWKVFCWIYDISTFDLKNINKNRDFFNDFVMTWTVSKTVLEQNLEKELIEDIQIFINEIEQNK